MVGWTISGGARQVIPDERVLFPAEGDRISNSQAIMEVARLPNELGRMSRELSLRTRKLEEGRGKIRTLHTLLPTCASCKRSGPKTVPGNPWRRTCAGLRTVSSPTVSVRTADGASTGRAGRNDDLLGTLSKECRGRKNPSHYAAYHVSSTLDLATERVEELFRDGRNLRGMSRESYRARAGNPTDPRHPSSASGPPVAPDLVVYLHRLELRPRNETDCAVHCHQAAGGLFRDDRLSLRATVAQERSLTLHPEWKPATSRQARQKEKWSTPKSAPAPMLHHGSPPGSMSLSSRYSTPWPAGFGPLPRLRGSRGRPGGQLEGTPCHLHLLSKMPILDEGDQKPRELRMEQNPEVSH